jgi:hypothetical protein
MSLREPVKDDPFLGSGMDPKQRAFNLVMARAA